MPTLTPVVTAALLTALALALVDRGARRLALVASVPVVLAMLAQGQALAVRGVLDARFLVVNGSILATGLLLLLAACARGARAGHALRSAPLLVLACWLGVAAARGDQLPARALLVGAGAAAMLYGVAVLVRPAVAATPSPPDVRPWWPGALLALLGMFLPHMAGMAIAAVLFLWWCRWRVRATLATALLGPSIVLAMAIAGPVGLGTSTLAEVPASPYASVILGGTLLLAALVIAGVFPFARDESRLLAAPLAAALVLHVVLVAVPDGVAHWRSLVAAWLVAACLVAAVRGRPVAFTTALGLFVVVVGAGRAAAWSGGLLTLLGAGLVLLGSRRLPVWALGPCAVAIAGLATAGLRAALAQEVTYSVLMAGAVMVLVLRLPQCFANTADLARASNETTS